MTEIKTLIQNFKKVTLGHTLREGNSEADEICNLTMDAGIRNNFTNGYVYTLFAGKAIPQTPKIEDKKQLELFDF